MTNNFRLSLGVSLSVLAFSLTTSTVSAQTCTVPPTCESLGFNKTAAQCGNLATLKCPFDSSKLFCTAFTDAEGNTPIAVGDYAYSDGTFSAALKPGKIAIGVIFNTSGLAVALDNYMDVKYDTFSKTKCSGYTVGSLSLWKNSTKEHLLSMYRNKTKIDSALSAVSATPLGSSRITYGEPSSIYLRYIDFSNGNDTSGSGSHPIRCIIDITSINATPVTPTTTYNVGDTYVKDGIALGKVVSVDSTGQHGYITISGGIGTASEANAQCNGKTAGGLNWSLTNGTRTCKTLSDTSNGCIYHSAAGTGDCFSGWRTNPYNQCNGTESLGFACEAPF